MMGYYEESDEVRKARWARERAENYPNEQNYAHPDRDQPALHVYGEDGSYSVWLNPDGTPDTGLCIGTGDTRQGAVTQAVASLEWAVEQLQSIARE